MDLQHKSTALQGEKDKHISEPWSGPEERLYNSKAALNWLGGNWGRERGSGRGGSTGREERAISIKKSRQIPRIQLHASPKSRSSHGPSAPEQCIWPDNRNNQPRGHY